TVLQATGQLREAAPYLDSARDLFPEPWPGDAKAGAWFKEVEGYQAKLLRSRLRESAGAPGGRPRAANDVDALFPVRFTDPGGKFEAGKLTTDDKAKLPANAAAVVQQLVLWFPDDTRLLWLLGEIYNANGDLDAAFGAL